MTIATEPATTPTAALNIARSTFEATPIMLVRIICEERFILHDIYRFFMTANIIRKAQKLAHSKTFYYLCHEVMTNHTDKQKK
jgi:hypothetical protein